MLSATVLYPIATMPFPVYHWNTHQPICNLFAFPFALLAILGWGLGLKPADNLPCIFSLQVIAVNTTEELLSLLNSEEFDFRFACGHTKPTQKMNLLDANEMVRSVWLHHVLYSPHAELEQLRKGLHIASPTARVLQCEWSEGTSSFFDAI